VITTDLPSSASQKEIVTVGIMVPTHVAMVVMIILAETMETVMAMAVTILAMIMIMVVMVVREEIMVMAMATRMHLEIVEEITMVRTQIMEAREIAVMEKVGIITQEEIQNECQVLSPELFRMSR
jgi:hypothetical protein